MFIGRKRFTISLALAVSLLLSSVTSAQVNNVATGDWSRVRAVASGSKLVVKLKNGKTIKGKMRSASDSALSLSAGNKLTDLNREDVQSVYHVMGKSATKATLIGLAVGAGAGAIIGAAGEDNNDFLISKGQAAAIFGALGAGAGALTGYLIGRHGHKRVLIYEAK